MKRRGQRAVPLFAGAVAIMALSAACLGAGDDSDGGDDGPPVVISTPRLTETPPPTRPPTPTPSPSPTPTLTPVCGPNPDPAPASLLQVLEPEPDAEVKIPFSVRGWGSTIGQDNAGVAVAVVDARQQVITVLELPPQPGAFRVPPPGLEITEFTRPFAADIVLGSVPEPTRYCIWTYVETDDEGNPRQVVQVPVTVVP